MASLLPFLKVAAAQLEHEENNPAVERGGPAVWCLCPNVMLKYALKQWILFEVVPLPMG